MALDHPTIAIIGAGAVGGYYGARLAQHSHDVHFLLRSDYPIVRRQGLIIKSCDGDFSLLPQRLHIHDDPRRMPQADLVIVALKATSNDLYQPLIAPLVKEDTAILTLQNGLGNEERLADLFGTHRILGGLCFVCLNRLAPGVIHHLDHGLVRLGEFATPPGQRLHRLAALFSDSQIRCQTLNDLRWGRWEKLVWNIPFNALGAILDLSTDQLIGQPSGLELLQQIMAEVIAAARALGVIFPPDIIQTKLTQTRSMGAYRSSMQIDRQMGRPLEIEAILGAPLRAAQAAGVPTPHLAMLYNLARLVKLGKPAPPM